MTQASESRNAAQDSALPQKKRARRRLVGAAALCLAAAIALPLLFDAEPRQLPAEIQVDIPSRDVPLNRLAGEPLPGTSGAVVSASPDSTSATQADDLVKALPSLADPRPPESGSASSANARDTSPPPAGDTAKGSAGKLADRAASKAAAEKAAAEKAAADKAAATKLAKAAPPTGARRYVLQIGAFASERSAHAQADKVTAAGLAAFTERIKTSQGDRIRVRVGPFSSRELAEQARGQLKLVGIDSALIAP